MTNLALVGSSLQAFGHPTSCSEPALGTVDGDSTVSINGTPIAAETDCTMEFDGHAHDVVDDECVDIQSHSIQPDAGGLSDSITINGNSVYLVLDNSGTDPGSGGNIDYGDSGGNSSVVT